MELEFLPANPAFAEAFLVWRSDPETIRFNPIQKRTLEDLREQLKKPLHDLKSLDYKGFYQWFIRVIERDGKRIVGNVTLGTFNEMMLTAEIGYAVTPKVRGRGIATAALRLMTKRIFSETPLRKLVAYVHEENAASRRVLEKAGFKLEGVLREHYIVDGKPANEAVYGCLRSDI